MICIQPPGTKKRENWKHLNNVQLAKVCETKQPDLSEQRSVTAIQAWYDGNKGIPPNSGSCWILPSQLIQGLAHEPRKIAQGFAHYFGTVVAKIRGGFMGSTWRPGLSSKVRHVFKLSSISEEFARKELKNIKSSKSTRLSDIPARLLKDGSGAIAIPPWTGPSLKAQYLWSGNMPL